MLDRIEAPAQCVDDPGKPLRPRFGMSELVSDCLDSSVRLGGADPHVLAAPVDGTIQEMGTLHLEAVFSVRGIRHSLESLCPQIEVAPYRGGMFAIISLSPRNVHRIFSPVDGILERLVHVPGHRMMLTENRKTNEFPVFSLNERLIMQLATPYGKCLVIVVAGWGVGHITHPFPVSRRFSVRNVTARELMPARVATCGEWLAACELGTMVLVITDKDLLTDSAFVAEGHVHSGQPLLRRISPAYDH